MKVTITIKDYFDDDEIQSVISVLNVHLENLRKTQQSLDSETAEEMK